MDELIAKVSQAAGITADQARQAVTTVMDFMKSKFPDVTGSIQGFVAGLDKDGDGLDLGDVKNVFSGMDRDGDGLDLGDVKGAVSGMFGKKDDTPTPPAT